MLTHEPAVMPASCSLVQIGRYYQQRPNDTSVNDYDRIKVRTS